MEIYDSESCAGWSGTEDAREKGFVTVEAQRKLAFAAEQVRGSTVCLVPGELSATSFSRGGGTWRDEAWRDHGGLEACLNAADGSS